jgi:hypothetical protein
MQLCGRIDFVRPFIWNPVSGLRRFRDALNFAQISENVTETVTIIIEALGGKSLSHKWVFEW